MIGPWSQTERLEEAYYSLLSLWLLDRGTARERKCMHIVEEEVDKPGNYFLGLHSLISVLAAWALQGRAFLRRASGSEPRTQLLAHAWSTSIPRLCIRISRTCIVSMQTPALRYIAWWSSEWGDVKSLLEFGRGLRFSSLVPQACYCYCALMRAAKHSGVVA